MSDRKSATSRANEATAPLGTTTPGAVTAGVRELRDHLSRYLDVVKAGSPVTVTEHGAVIATIVPRQFSSHMLDLAAQGVITLPAQPKGDPSDWPRVELDGGLSRFLEDVR